MNGWDKQTFLYWIQTKFIISLINPIDTIISSVNTIITQSIIYLYKPNRYNKQATNYKQRWQRSNDNYPLNQDTSHNNQNNYPNNPLPYTIKNPKPSDKGNSANSFPNPNSSHKPRNDPTITMLWVTRMRTLITITITITAAIRLMYCWRRRSRKNPNSLNHSSRQVPTASWRYRLRQVPTTNSRKRSQRTRKNHTSPPIATT